MSEAYLNGKQPHKAQDSCSQSRMPRHVLSLESGGASTSRQLHWLPVHQQVDFKLSILIYRSLAGTAPDECTTVTASGRHQLWSADSWTYSCMVNQYAKHLRLS